MHQIAPRIAAGSDRPPDGSRRSAPSRSWPCLSRGALRAQETGQTGTPETFGAQPGAPAPGGQLGRTTTAPPPPAEPGLEVRQFQDWAVRCGQPAEGAQEACEMVQQRLDEKGQTVLAIAVGKVPNTNDPGMLIILPLGIWLPPGRRPQGRRRRGGARAGRALRAPRLPGRAAAGAEGAHAPERRAREANVLFQIYDENGQPKVVGVPFSLLGFTAALTEIMA